MGTKLPHMQKDWDGDHQKQNVQQNIPYTQSQDTQRPQQKNFLQVQNLQQPQNTQQYQL